MERAERFYIDRGAELVHRPSGLIVEVLAVGWDSHFVRFPRGGEMSILIEHLERREE